MAGEISFQVEVVVPWWGWLACWLAIVVFHEPPPRWAIKYRIKTSR